MRRLTIGIVDFREWQWLQAVPSEDLMHSERDIFVSAKSSDNNFHFLPRQEGVRKTDLTLLFDITQEFIVMVGIMMRDNELLNPRVFCHFQCLRITAMPPAFKARQFFGGVLCFVDQNVRVMR